jgi:hypothetical protein
VQLWSSSFLTAWFYFGSSSQLDSEKLGPVTGEDLEHLYQLVEERDGGPAWIQMMDRSTSTMGYQAWRRDPEVAFHSLLEMFRNGYVVW